MRRGAGSWLLAGRRRAGRWQRVRREVAAGREAWEAADREAKADASRLGSKWGQ